jgi:hypothetical protein
MITATTVRHAAIAALLLALPCRAAVAAPLDAPTCDKLRYEQLELADVPRLMERGAAWGKANATPAQLKRVARWIDIEEKLQFRCGQVRLTPGAERAAAAAEALETPPPPPPVAADVTVGAPATAQPAAEATAEPPKPKPRPKPKPKPTTAEAAPADTAAPPVTESAPPAPKPKPKPKPAAPPADAAAEGRAQ